MPLRCFDPVADIRVLAFDLSREEWAALELKNRSERHLKMPCCSSQVTLKRSRRGTQFFTHKSVGACSTAPETEAHLHLKRMAVEAAREYGWDAETEVTGTAASGEQWRADVLARKGGHKVAIEVQWSAQTNDETLRRQACYARSGVRCLWLLKQPHFPVDNALPAARISGSPEEGFVAHVPTGSGQQSVPVQDFLRAAFSNRLKFGVPLGYAANVSIRSGQMFCWACGAQMEIITGINVALGPHRCEFSVPDLGTYPDLFEIVRGYLPNDPWLRTIKPRFSKTQDRSYLSNGCVHCGAFVGEFYEHDARDDQTTICEFQVRIDERWQQAIHGHGGYEKGWGIYP